MVVCQFSPTLGRFHDGELSSEERAGFQQHLMGCPSCTAELGELQAISRTLRAGVMPTASPEFVSRLEQLESEVADVTVIRFARRMTAAAAAILGGASVFWAIRPQPAAPVVAQASSYVTADERMVIDPESAVAMVTSDPTPAAVEPQLDLISLDLSKGRP